MESRPAAFGHEETVDDGVYIVDNLRVVKVTFSCKRAPRCQARPASVARNFGSARCPTAAIGLLRCQPVSATYSGDVPALGLLFFAAFHGTIDDAGHTETQYALKAAAILGGRYGEWIPEASWIVEQTGGLQSACLVCDYQPYGCPVIAVVATAPANQRFGTAGTLLDAALATLSALGHPECCAMVTQGNVASERLFGSRGFFPHADVRGS